MVELEKRPWHYARDYLMHEKAKDKAIEMGIREAAVRHKQAMQQVWDSIPPHLLDMVKDRISNERAKESLK